MGEKEHRDKEQREKDRGEKDRREKEELEFSTTARGAGVAEYLNLIADGLRQGTLTLTANGSTVHLNPADLVRLEVEAESKPEKGTASLQLELSWKHVKEARAPREEQLIIEVAPRGESAPGD